GVNQEGARNKNGPALRAGPFDGLGGYFLLPAGRGAAALSAGGAAATLPAATSSSSSSSQPMIHTHSPATSVVATISASHCPASRPTLRASKTTMAFMPRASTIQAVRRGWVLIHWVIELMLESPYPPVLVCRGDGAPP